VPVRKYLPSAVVIALMVATPAFAADMSALPELPPVTQSAAPQPAFGDGFDPLTGSPAVPVHQPGWQGFYIGGQFSYSVASGDFSTSTQNPIAYSLRETTLESDYAPSSWPILGTATPSRAGFGGYVGYNFEFLTPNARVVLGFEANYDQANLTLNAPSSPLSLLLPAGASGNSYYVHLTGNGTISDLNFGTLRARAGWAFGNFLPYAFAGVAIGHADVNITTTTSGYYNPALSGSCLLSSTPPCIPFSETGTGGKNSDWTAGVAAGAGVDMALTPNVFLRGEYEYVAFQSMEGIAVHLNTVRVGGAFKF
jgi:outer membrane immunogenic protein